MNRDDLQQAYDRLVDEGQRLAGGPTDLARRAGVYHHVYYDSGRNHVFPLIAAHGALWASGYFAFGLRLARWLSWQYAHDPSLRRRQVAAGEAFANVLRDINRRVCADTYAKYHFTAVHGHRSCADELIAPDLLDALSRVHAARRSGRELCDADKLAVFRAHFLHEQEHVVGPTIATAIAELRWPLVRQIALKPLIRFAYFPRGERLWFAGFSDREERIGHGLRAFELVAQRGWKQTADALRQYDVLPSELFADSAGEFAKLRDSAAGLC